MKSIGYTNFWRSKQLQQPLVQDTHPNYTSFEKTNVLNLNVNDRVKLENSHQCFPFLFHKPYFGKEGFITELNINNEYKVKLDDGTNITVNYNELKKINLTHQI
jgi:hypothetical protein